MRIVVSSDVPDEIHLHGYDIEKEAAPGKPARFRFKADAEGAFELESHAAEDAGEEPLAGAPARRPVVITVFAHAGGLLGRADLPIPEWLFGWAAAMVLVDLLRGARGAVAGAKLERERWRPLPGGVGRVLASRPVEFVCGAIGVALLGVVVYTGLQGTQSPAANFAPTFVFVIFWIGLVPVSVLFGDVFRAFNPWRAIGRAVGWTAGGRRAAGCPRR